MTERGRERARTDEDVGHSALACLLREVVLDISAVVPGVEAEEQAEEMSVCRSPAMRLRQTYSITVIWTLGYSAAKRPLAFWQKGQVVLAKMTTLF